MVGIAKKKQNTGWGITKSGWTDKLVVLNGALLSYYKPYSGGKSNRIIPKTKPRASINLHNTRLSQQARRLTFQTPNGKSFIFEFDRWPVFIPGRCAHCVTLNKNKRPKYTCKICGVDICVEHTKAGNICSLCHSKDSKAAIGGTRGRGIASNPKITTGRAIEEDKDVDFVQVREKRIPWCEVCGGEWAKQSEIRPYLCGKCDWQQPELSFCISEARNLKVQDLNGLADPYCTIYVEDRKFRTETVETTLRPVWGTDNWFTTKLVGLGQGMHIVIFDMDTITADDFMGMVYIPFSSLPNGQIYSDWLPLHNVPGMPSEYLGEVKVHVSLTVPLVSHWAPMPNLRLKQMGRQPPKGIGEAIDAVTSSVDRIKRIVAMVTASNIGKGIENLRLWKNPGFTITTILYSLFLVYNIPPNLIVAVPVVCLALILVANYISMARKRLKKIDKSELEKSSVRRPICAKKRTMDRQVTLSLTLPGQKKQFIGIADDIATSAETVDRVFALFIWEDQRKTILVLLACILGCIALVIVPFRLAVMGGLIGFFADYLLSKKYLKEELYVWRANSPEWDPSTLGSCVPYSELPSDALFPRFRKKRHKNDPLKDFIRRAPLTDDDRPTKVNIPLDIRGASS
ncbi:hypothetical protein AAMO2058_001233100 [Amorphochlora amoebiformis]